MMELELLAQRIIDWILEKNSRHRILSSPPPLRTMRKDIKHLFMQFIYGVTLE